MTHYSLEIIGIFIEHMRNKIVIYKVRNKILTKNYNKMSVCNISILKFNHV
jgi:hypothetical protein